MCSIYKTEKEGDCQEGGKQESHQSSWGLHTPQLEEMDQVGVCDKKMAGTMEIFHNFRIASESEVVNLVEEKDVFSRREKLHVDGAIMCSGSETKIMEDTTIMAFPELARFRMAL